MSGLVKNLWALFFACLYFGIWTFVILGVYALFLVFMYWLKPDWFEKYC